jgi:hypothetical protein
MEREITLFSQPATLVADFSKTYCPINGLMFYSLWTTAFTVVIGLIALLLWDRHKQITKVIRGKT